MTGHSNENPHGGHYMLRHVLWCPTLRQIHDVCTDNLVYLLVILTTSAREGGLMLQGAMVDVMGTRGCGLGYAEKCQCAHVNNGIVSQTPPS